MFSLALLLVVANLLYIYILNTPFDMDQNNGTAAFTTFKAYTLIWSWLHPSKRCLRIPCQPTPATKVLKNFRTPKRSTFLKFQPGFSKWRYTNGLPLWKDPPFYSWVSPLFLWSYTIVYPKTHHPPLRVGQGHDQVTGKGWGPTALPMM